jgi:hypothetical protein
MSFIEGPIPGPFGLPRPHSNPLDRGRPMPLDGIRAMQVGPVEPPEEGSGGVPGVPGEPSPLGGPENTPVTPRGRREQMLPAATYARTDAASQVIHDSRSWPGNFVGMRTSAWLAQPEHDENDATHFGGYRLTTMREGDMLTEARLLEVSETPAYGGDLEVTVRLTSMDQSGLVRSYHNVVEEPAAYREMRGIFVNRFLRDVDEGAIMAVPTDGEALVGVVEKRAGEITQEQDLKAARSALSSEDVAYVEGLDQAREDRPDYDKVYLERLFGMRIPEDPGAET